MDLIRDLLDTRILDKQGRRIGRVDGVWLRVDARRPPRVLSAEAGLSTVSHRIHKSFGRLVRAWIVRRSGRLRAVKFPVTVWTKLDKDLHVDLDAECQGQLLRFEKWLRRNIVNRIPGGGAR
jgi:hypothetical protein